MSFKKFIFLSLLLAVCLGVNAYAQTASVLPDQVPKGAYVNGPGGTTDDNQYFQQVHIVMAGTHAAGTIVITLPTGMTVADYDGGGFLAQVGVSYTTAGTGTFTATAADANSITLTLANVFALNDEVYVTFPVETAVNPTVDSDGYDINFSDNPGHTDITSDDPSTQITYRDSGALQLVNFAALLSADDDSTSDYGEMYPSAVDNSLMAAALTDLVEDGSATNNGGGFVTLDASDVDDVVYMVWISTDSTLSHISEFQSGVVHAIDYDNAGVNYTMNEGDFGNQTGETKGRIATSGLTEGVYYLYITSSLTGDFPLMRSGALTVLHYPVVRIMGWDYNDMTAPDGFDNVPTPYDDDNTMTLDSGSYVDYTGDIAGPNGATDFTDLYVSVDDFDDNAQVILFYSTDPDLTVDDLVVSGPDTALVVDSLDSEIALTDTLYENQEDTEGFIAWRWDVLPGDGTYVPEGDYYMYAVANDGKHQHLLKAAGASGSADIKINVRNSPNLVLNTLAEYDSDVGAGVPFTINLSQTDVVMLSWGKQGIGGDEDIDNSCLISLFVHEDADPDNDPDYLSEDADLLEANAQLIVSGLEEDLESKGVSYYTWDIKAFSDSTGWFPAEGINHHIYAIIEEADVEDGTRRVVALNPGDALQNLVEAGDTLEEIRFVNDGFVRLYDPPVEGVTVYGHETYRMRFSAFDVDLDAEVGIAVLQVGETIGGVDGPATATATELGGVSVATSWCLTSINGSFAGGAGVWPVEGTDTYYDLTVRLPSEGTSRYTTDLTGAGNILAAGEYWVYIGLDDDNNDFADGTEEFYRASGTITFINVADANVPVQRHLMLTPDMVSVAEGDSMEFEVRGADEAAGDDFVDLIDVYIAVEKDYFDVVSSSTPFTDSVPGAGTLIANRTIDDTDNNRWILNATAYEGSNDIPLADDDLGTVFASFTLVAKGTTNAIEANSAVYYVREPANGWVTKFSQDDTELAIIIGSQRVTEQPRGIVEGIVEFEGRDTSDMVVTFDLRKRGSYVNEDDTGFYTRNDGAIYGSTSTLDAGDITPEGIQYQLDTDGHLELFQVPPGEWDLVVNYNRYLSVLKQVSVYSGLDTLFVNFGTLLGGDCVGYTDSLGVEWPNNRIDDDDINQISNAFLATPSHENWDAPDNWKWADIDESDQVDIVDLTMATGNFTGTDVDGDQPVYAKPAVEPASNMDALVAVHNLPTELKAGNTYTVQVIARNTADVKGYFVNLGYDSNALEIMSVENGNFIDYSLGFAFPVYNEGAIGFASALYGSDKVSGDGILASFSFTALSDGAFSADMISLTEASFVNSSLVKETVLFSSPTAVDELPGEFALNQNFPNPFNPTTSISFSVPSNGLVKVTIYDILGREVRTLVNGAYTAGTYSVVWDARDTRGAQVSAGVYFYTIEAGNFRAAKRMVFMK
ncbi:FlgD immunoglobulin-like domain containing protein [Candidatus Latescibacterota bacterium]